MWQKKIQIFVLGKFGNYMQKNGIFTLCLAFWRNFAPKMKRCQQKKQRQILSIPGDNQDWHVEPGSHCRPPPFFL